MLIFIIINVEQFMKLNINMTTININSEDTKLIKSDCKYIYGVTKVFFFKQILFLLNLLFWKMLENIISFHKQYLKSKKYIWL